MNNRNQEWFDKMVRGMANQLWIRATLGDGRCTYRSIDGSKCGVGQIIPDDAPCIRTNYTVLLLKARGRMQDLGLGPISENEEVFLLDAQTAHDIYEQPFRVKIEFIIIGERFRLTWPEGL